MAAFGSLGANTATYFLDTVLTACQFMYEDCSESTVAMSSSTTTSHTRNT